MNNKIRIIGDVHGKVYSYYERIQKCNYSIQIGDFGFKNEWNWLVENKINSNRHKIIPGNHDDYDNIQNQYTFGIDYGPIKFGGIEFFFIRGAFSIDKNLRIPGISWWKEEQLSYNVLQNAINLYKKIKPEIVITHDCPAEIGSMLFKKKAIPNITSSALKMMWDIHQPNMWIFGHWHITLKKQIKNTTFICLDELAYIDLEKSNIVIPNTLQ